MTIRYPNNVAPTKAIAHGELSYTSIPAIPAACMVDNFKGEERNYHHNSRDVPMESYSRSHKSQLKGQA